MPRVAAARDNLECGGSTPLSLIFRVVAAGLQTRSFHFASLSLLLGVGASAPTFNSIHQPASAAEELLLTLFAPANTKDGT
jgi:hypothetical protein